MLKKLILKNGKKDYNEWLKNNEHLPEERRKSADEILEMPRAKTEPPKPLMPNFTDSQLEEWKKEYQKWYNENTHLPNLQPADKIAQTFVQRKKQFEQQNAQQNVVNAQIEDRISVMEEKLDRLMEHLGVK